MPQRPKIEVREAILQAAAEVFAEVGFERAVLGDVVERAGTSIGNLYKYFPSKAELFAVFMPRAFPSELERRLRAQVQALRGEPDAFLLAPDHPYHRASAELLTFAIAERERVIFLLLRAQGTRYEDFSAKLVEFLVELAFEHARATYPGFDPTPARRRAFSRLYRGFVGTLGAILLEERSAEAVRRATTLHTTYHLSGLKAVFLDPGLHPPGSPTR